LRHLAFLAFAFVPCAAALLFTGGGTINLRMESGREMPDHFRAGETHRQDVRAVHADDSCGATPYLEARRLEQRFALVTVHGGKPSESPACEPQSQHGFYGKDAETVDAVAAGMLTKPFAKEIR
jgi:hypothetical protein